MHDPLLAATLVGLKTLLEKQHAHMGIQSHSASFIRNQHDVGDAFKLIPGHWQRILKNGFTTSSMT